jgi:hypothetical protein
MAQNNQLDGGAWLNEVGQKQPRLAALLQKMIDHVNNGFKALAATGGGEIGPPAPPASVTVSAAATGETVHVQISHPDPFLQKGAQYFTHVGVNDPNFVQPLTIDHGASRTPHPFTLPTMDSGGATVKYYFRSFAQYHGSARSPYTYWGTEQSPTAVTLNGSTKHTLLPSTGSGTGDNSGRQPAGLGDTLVRAPGNKPKRTLGSV